MIKHIIKQIWVERRQNSWILLELVVVFFFFLLMSDFLWVKIKNYIEPKGFDIENTYLLQLKLLKPIASQYVNPEENTMTRVEELFRLVEQIGQYPDVESTSVSLHSAPYSMGGYWMGVESDSSQIPNSIRIRQITPSYFDVFRIRSADGSPIRIENAGHRQAILTEDMARLLFSSAENAIGQEVELSGNEAENKAKVVAVSTKHKRQDFFPYEGTYYEILTPSELEKLETGNQITMLDLCVRIRPGTAQHFRENFEAEMGDRLRVNNLYVASVIPSEKLRDNEVGKMLRQDVLPMVYVMIFVIITVFLGVFGTFWLRTYQKQSEIGIRMAMGATQRTIRISMLCESLLLIAIALLPPFLVYLNLLNAEILDVWRLPFTLGRVVLVFFASLFMMILIVVCGTFWPAHRAAAIQPVEALKNE